MTESHGSGENIHCPACDRAPSGDRPSGVVPSEPATHCEWCGAEYPVPDPDDSAWVEDGSS